jgi:hypothetical protein
MSVEFTKEETAALIQLLVGKSKAIRSHSHRIRRLGDILRKIRPVPELESNPAEIKDDASA